MWKQVKPWEVSDLSTQDQRRFRTWNDEVHWLHVNTYKTTLNSFKTWVGVEENWRCPSEKNIFYRTPCRTLNWIILNCLSAKIWALIVVKNTSQIMNLKLLCIDQKTLLIKFNFPLPFIVWRLTLFILWKEINYQIHCFVASMQWIWDI